MRWPITDCHPVYLAMRESIVSFVQSISSAALAVPLAKGLYTLLLVLGIGVLVGEVARVWTQQSLVVGTFQYFAATGEQKVAEGKSFTALVLHQHRLLVDQLRLEEARRKAKASVDSNLEATWWPFSPAPIQDSRSALSDIELSVQGINLAQILTFLRRWVTPPNEVSGHVAATPTGFRVLVEWPKAPQRQDGGLADARTFTLQGIESEADASFEVACTLVWTEAAARQDQLFGVARQDFCAWARAWIVFTGLRARTEAIRPLGDEGRKSLSLSRDILDGLAARKDPYPEVFRLRAEVLELLPADLRRPGDAETAIADRLRYAAMVTGKPDTNVMAGVGQGLEATILADARPALPLRAGRIVGETPEAWKPITQGALRSFFEVARSTGFVRIQGTNAPFSGTGFVVGHELVMTAAFVVEGHPRGAKIEFVVGDDVSSTASTVHPVAEVILARTKDGHDDTPSIALLRVPGLDSATYPPLHLQRAPIAESDFLNRAILVVGYPTAGVGTAVKHAMLGRLLRPETRDSANFIAYDVNTGPGTSGAPVIDLASGLAIGLHVGGKVESSGAHAYGLPMADILLLPAVAKLLGTQSPTAHPATSKPSPNPS